MTSIVLTLVLDHELKKINRLIDHKIDHGQNYKKEARLHRQIVKRINSLKKGKGVLSLL